MSAQILPQLYNTKEAANLLRVSPITVRRWTCQGKMPFCKVNGRVVFTEAQLASMVKVQA